jgi:hypothetical protein
MPWRQIRALLAARALDPQLTVATDGQHHLRRDRVGALAGDLKHHAPAAGLLLLCQQEIHQFVQSAVDPA